jgi:AraC-like DNA-binding protein/GNAT superfamily N-acetyltransferase
MLSDDGIRHYVDGIDLTRDALFVVTGMDLAIIGAAHLAREDGHAQLGISVLPQSRGQGIGDALLERCAARARNWGMRVMFMNCLVENAAMMHLARKQGLKIAVSGAEAEAFVSLPRPDLTSLAAEAVAEHLGLGGCPVPETSALIGGHVIDLISHAPAFLSDMSVMRAHTPVLLSMMLDHIDRHSHDPDLSAATLAAKFRCSERYVHRLFAVTGRPVGEHVNDKRIAACTSRLLEQKSAHKTIAEIAFAAGFRDISHFNRLFKRCNGLAPREFRRAMAAR